MSKAYVGFSAPVGYDYINHAQKVSSDISSSPNPIIVGATGLFVLFDEIWFPCRSICPQSMRDLSYVKFLSDEYSNVDIDDTEAKRIAATITPQLGLNDLHPDGYNAFMEKYYGFAGPDNHTHGISFFDNILNGNLDTLSLVRDILILDQIGDGFTPVLNGITRKMSFPQEWVWLKNEQDDRAIQVVDRLLTTSGIYDITGHDGPYHPVMEELREHHFIKSFRKWIRGETSALHNNTPSDIAYEVNNIVREFEKTSLRKAVGKDSLKEVSVKLIEGAVLDLIPGASAIKTTMDIIKERRDLEKKKVSAYISESRGAVWDARGESVVNFF